MMKTMKTVKKAICLFLAFLLLACVSACGKGGESTPANPAAPAEVKEPVNLDALIIDLTTKYEMTDGFVFSSSSTELGEYLDDDLIQSYYGDASVKPDFTKISEYCVYIDESSPYILTDVGAFRLTDPSYADTLMKFIQGRIDVRIENGARYPDIDVATLKKAVVAKAGDVVYYAVGYDSAALAAALKDALS
ncbi:MAG: DUF4358 domain-containing protein [Clostridiales bacterium]|nr:DUF4358 domain-containing protein [Clostridiales bacterium]